MVTLRGEVIARLVCTIADTRSIAPENPTCHWIGQTTLANQLTDKNGDHQTTDKLISGVVVAYNRHELLAPQVVPTSAHHLASKKEKKTTTTNK